MQQRLASRSQRILPKPEALHTAVLQGVFAVSDDAEILVSHLYAKRSSKMGRRIE